MLAFVASVVLLRAVPDPRLADAARHDEAGWIQVHLQGKPRDVGYQYGSLLAKEIDDAHHALKEGIQAPYDWAWYRETARKLFWTKVDPEYQQEMEGQAEGLKAKGYKYDVWDVLAYNSQIELEGYYIPWLQAQRTGLVVSGAKESCSAFVATGSYTKDGNIVMGHNLWWDYKMGQRANVILDIEPEHGERVVMDVFCGLIDSGTDFAVNSAGITLCETTISGFAGFDPQGIPEFVRMRKAIQYSKSVEDVVKIFREGNNGGYANTWLIADQKTKKIGKLELGLRNVSLHTTHDGYYVGSNFPEDPKLIAEEVPGGWDKDPARNSCENRRARWKQLLTDNRGKIDAEMGKAFLADTFDQTRQKQGASDSTLCGKSPWGGACNTKVVSAEMVKNLQFWARMGFSDGSEMKFTHPSSTYLKDIVSHPWMIVKAQ